MIMARQQVAFSSKQFTVAGSMQSHCAGIVFRNRGTSVARINDDVLQPGEFLSLGVNTGEIDVTSYNISFTGGGTNLLIVWQKTYC